MSLRFTTATDATASQSPEDGRPQRYLLPGELFASLEPVLVKTILGSCVAVCLWDSEQRIGGINHFLLPQGVSALESAGRFGNLALPELLEQMRRVGAQPRAMTAKVFGGAALVVPVPPPNHIGAQNVDVAIRWLEHNEIPVVGSDTGGPRGRKLVFDTGDGSVSLWTL